MATHSIRLFPLHFSSRASPCATRFRFHSNTRKTQTLLSEPAWAFRSQAVYVFMTLDRRSLCWARLDSTDVESELMQVCMCVCMYGCMYYVCIYMYVCMYLCIMQVCMCVCLCVCMCVRMHAYMHVCMHLSMYVCIYVFFHVCMYE